MPRDSDPKRHRSRFDSQSSPKRSRRDGNLVTERSPKRLNEEVRDKDNDRKRHRRLQDPLPLQAPPASNSKLDLGDSIKASNRNANQPDPTDVPRSRTYFQHDDRAKAGLDGRSSSRRETSERGWWRNSKDEPRRMEKKPTSDLKEKEKSPAKEDDNRMWRHNRFSERNADTTQTVKKRRQFREEKLPPEQSQSLDKAAPDHVKPSNPDGSSGGTERHRHQVRADRDRPHGGDRLVPNRTRPEKGGFPSRDRFRGRDGFSGRQGYRSGGGGGRVEKWKHDLFDEANRSPTPKNEEDPVAKVEALLAL